MDMHSFISGIFTGIGISIVLCVLYFVVKDFLVLPWLRSHFAGAPVPMVQIIGMRLRGSPPKLLVSVYIAMIQAGEKTSIADAESVYLAQGNKEIDAATLIQMVREHERNKEGL